ncbi:MAG: hypothetical protein ACJ77K_14410 [Bacteroidia bacterium]
MKKLFSCLLFVAVIFSLPGCITDHYLRKQNKERPSAFSTEAFNGEYLNYENNDSAYLSLWRMLYTCKTTNPDFTPGSKNSTVNLSYDGKNKLTAVFFDKASQKDTLELKVKRKGDYLSIKRSLFLIPIPLLFYIHRENKALLSLQNGLLNVNYCHLSRGQILIGASADYDAHEQFRKK